MIRSQCSQFNDVGKAAPAPEKLYPMSFRVTLREKKRIKNYAKNQSVSAYLRDVALKGKPAKRKASPAVKVEMAARILGALGQSGTLANLETIATAAEMGALPVTDELEAELRNACALILAMRNDLITALGIKPQE